MLEINVKDKNFIGVKNSGLKQENLMERRDLQKCIVNSWKMFTKEIGMDGILYIGDEISPHISVNDRTDILAFDKNESTIIIFELKREQDKKQLIQSISYAGMINTWDSDDIIKHVKSENKELVELFSNNEIDFKIKIVLIAESFEPEVILAADWLTTEHNVNICAYSIHLFKVDEKILFNIDQKYPLKELSDSYKPRKRKQVQENILDIKKLDKVKETLNYQFGKEAIDYLRKRYYYVPKDKIFYVTLNKDKIERILIYFRQKYISIYSYVEKENKENVKNILNQLFDNTMKLKQTKDGLSFKIENEEDYKKFIYWFKI